MIEPTFDRDGYPTDETLETIKAWPLESITDFEAVMDFVGRAWNYPDCWIKTRDFVDIDTGTAHPVVRYVFSTAGWSGNESLVSAIEGNQMLQMIGAYSWKRGGHYEYRFRQEKTNG